MLGGHSWSWGLGAVDVLIGNTAPLAPKTWTTVLVRKTSGTNQGFGIFGVADGSRRYAKATSRLTKWTGCLRGREIEKQVDESTLSFPPCFSLRAAKEMERSQEADDGRRGYMIYDFSKPRTIMLKKSTRRTLEASALRDRVSKNSTFASQGVR